MKAGRGVARPGWGREAVQAFRLFTSEGGYTHTVHRAEGNYARTLSNGPSRSLAGTPTHSYVHSILHLYTEIVTVNILCTYSRAQILYSFIILGCFGDGDGGWVCLVWACPQGRQVAWAWRGPSGEEDSTQQVKTTYNYILCGDIKYHYTYL